MKIKILDFLLTLGAVTLLALVGARLFHAELLSVESTKNFYKMPSDLTKAIGEIK